MYVYAVYCMSPCRKVKFGYFAQHHVDQLVMGISPLELLQSKHPGMCISCYVHMYMRRIVSSALPISDTFKFCCICLCVFIVVFTHLCMYVCR